MSSDSNTDTKSPSRPLDTASPRRFDHVRSFNDWFMHRIPLGPAVMHPRQAINLHKVSVGPLTLALMLAADDFSLAAWLYLALHGVYGLLWVAKDIAFGDPRQHTLRQ